MEIHHFYYNNLHITDNEIQTIPWASILEKVVQSQSSQQLCVVKDLPVHDVVMRLMRKENYLIGMLNIGRFWQSTGPQCNLYVPAPVLRNGENNLVIFELESPNSELVVHSVDRSSRLHMSFKQF
ncbi:hypothetical protein VitviT2T_014058 [Vitis vinifera]|uniref:Autophagy-related protein 9 n=1 Tax=Vitis vinifera TaxID=29760 RepID=A0ABY9CIK0_VITVI|nr:hypothetical protein VitviT2T_014058 [Vitis vinifera]